MNHHYFPNLFHSLRLQVVTHVHSNTQPRMLTPSPTVRRKGLQIQKMGSHRSETEHQSGLSLPIPIIRPLTMFTDHQQHQTQQSIATSAVGPIFFSFSFRYCVDYLGLCQHLHIVDIFKGPRGAQQSPPHPYEPIATPVLYEREANHPIGGIMTGRCAHWPRCRVRR